MSDPEAQRWTRPGFAAVADQVYAHCGLAVPPYRRQAAEAGMRLAMQRLGLDDIDVLGARIRTDRAALEVLVDELAVGETYFFREPAQFGALRDHILPDLLARRPAGHRLRVWSAGCASGEEAYSLAILFAEMGLGERVDLLATDVSAEKLARARAARFSAWSFRNDDGQRARRWMTAAGTHWQPVETIRSMVRFDRVNLAAPTWPSPTTGTWGLDLVLCRNVLLYFDPATVAAVAVRLGTALAPGGWLLTASGDPALPAAALRSARLAGMRAYRPPHHPTEAAPLAPPRPRPPLAPRRPTKPHGPPPLEQALAAYQAGDWARTVDLLAPFGDHEAATMWTVRALTNLDPDAADAASAAAVQRHPLSADLHYLRAMLQWQRGEAEAAGSFRKVLFLDPSHASAHLGLGAWLAHTGDRAGAVRALRAAARVCRAWGDQAVPLQDGLTGHQLADAATARMDSLAKEAP